MLLRVRLLSVLVVLCCIALVPGAALAGAPKVVATFPANGATDVDPATEVISVTFDTAMQAGRWSWVYESKDSFPDMAGEPSYSPDRKTCLLPVKLASGKTYVIWINSKAFNNFRSEAGVPAGPYKLTFSTR